MCTFCEILYINCTSFSVVSDVRSKGKHDMPGNLSTLHAEWKIGCFMSGGMDNNRGHGDRFSG